MDAASGVLRDLTPWEGVRASIVVELVDNPRHILFSHNRRDLKVFDVVRLNVRTGAETVGATNLGNVTHWITDHQGRVRLGAASDDRTLRARCVYDARNDKPSKLGNLTSWLPEAQMAPMKPMRYTARDGLEFPG